MSSGQGEIPDRRLKSASGQFGCRTGLFPVPTVKSGWKKMCWKSPPPI